MDKELIELYHERFGECAPELFRTDQINEIINNVSKKSRLLGNIVENYYVLFRGYLSRKREEKIFRKLTEKFQNDYLNSKGLEKYQLASFKN